MRYVMAIIRLILGLIEAILMFPVMLFTIPVQRYNEALYGKNVKTAVVRDLGNALEITLPSGEKILAPKVREDKQNGK